MNLRSKLPNVGTTIFTVMSAMAKEYDAINLSQGFPNFDPPAELIALVKKHMESGKNQYAPMAGAPELSNVLAKKINTLYGNDIDPASEITITSGGTQALFCAISAHIHPGDEVIIVEPAYDSYKPVVELCGAHVVPYTLTGPDYKIDWQALHRRFTRDTRMIIINNPHNPTGQVFDEHDLNELARITKGTNILVLSDEVYEHLIFDGKKHQSVLANPELYQRSLVTFSFGKTFHATGWKMGYCVAPPELMKEFRKIHQFNVFSVNSPKQHAIADFSKDFSFFAELPDFYQKKRDFFLQKMEKSRFKLISCSGTYFQLLDYSDISDLPDTEFAEWLVKEHGVATIPISPFCSIQTEDRVVRVCFAKTEAVLAEAAEKLVAI